LGDSSDLAKTMSPVSNALALDRLAIAVARKQLDSVEQQGKAALALIEASSPPSPDPKPPANAAPGVGSRLSVVA
jgi:hypothetical protein